MSLNYGGNSVVQHHLDAAPSTQFAGAPTAPYLYKHLHLVDGSEVPLDLEGGEFCLFVLFLTPGAALSTGFLHRELQQNEAVQVVNRKGTLKVLGGEARILVAGTPGSSRGQAGSIFFPSSAIKKVTKPWGHELWIHEGHAGYAFKEIFIKAGTKTSLQYHRHKQETNLLVAGEALLHYKADAAASIDAPGSAAIGTVALHPVSSVDVTPFILHRLEALTDILLYEVSTPFLDDVVRVSDDTNRPDGRSDAEHAR